MQDPTAVTTAKVRRQDQGGTLLSTVRARRAILEQSKEDFKSFSRQCCHGTHSFRNNSIKQNHDKVEEEETSVRETNSGQPQ